MWVARSEARRERRRRRRHVWSVSWREGEGLSKAVRRWRARAGNVEERKGERGVVEKKRRGTWDALCCATGRSAAKPELADDDKAQAVPRCENKE